MDYLEKMLGHHVLILWRQQDRSNVMKKSQKSLCWEGKRMDSRCQTQKWRLWGREVQPLHWGIMYPAKNLKALWTQRKGRRAPEAGRVCIALSQLVWEALGQTMGFGLPQLHCHSLWHSPVFVPGKWQFSGPLKTIGLCGIIQGGCI